jgi:hypothetical protein
MGYSTSFEGQVTVTPPLNAAEVAFLAAFADSRRHQRPDGPYSTTDARYDQDGYNTPPEGQPGLWCNWEATPDGTGIRWNGAEKFYYAAEWMTYLIDHFLKPAAHAQGHPGFEKFTFDHTVTGLIKAQGDEPDDTWDLVVDDNEVAGESPR